VAEKQKGKKGEHMVVLFIFATVVLVIGWLIGAYCRKALPRPESAFTRAVIKALMFIAWLITVSKMTPGNSVSEFWRYTGAGVWSFIAGGICGVMSNWNLLRRRHV
jgi:uncharacterized membrane protein